MAKTPYIANVQQTGYYRVNYQPENWKAIAALLKEDPKQIGWLNRAQLLDDSFNLARAGQLEYEIPLDLALYLSKETEYIPLQAGLDALSYLGGMFSDREEGKMLYEAFVTSLVADTLEDITFNIAEDATYPEILKQKSVLAELCSAGVAECVDPAKQLFAAWRENPEVNPIFPDMKQLVYEVAIRNGDEEGEDFDFLLAQLGEVEVAQDVQKIIYGLGATENEDKIKELLALTIAEDSPIRTQDMRYVYRALGRTAVGGRAMFRWFKDEFPAIYTFYGATLSRQVPEIMNGYLALVNTQEEIDEIQAFADEHRAEIGPGYTSIIQGLDKAVVNVQWMTANYDEIVRIWKKEAENSASAVGISAMSLAVVGVVAMFA